MFRKKSTVNLRLTVSISGNASMETFMNIISGSPLWSLGMSAFA